MLLPAMAPQDQTWAPSLFKKSLWGVPRKKRD
jgi:hypothetical protein